MYKNKPSIPIKADIVALFYHEAIFSLHNSVYYHANVLGITLSL